MATVSAARPATNGNPKPDSAPSSHQFTCNTCQVAFRYADTQKGHMKSDWHRYNLKRRVANLPPISSETFTEKVLEARAETTAEADKAGFQQLCEVCQRTYYSENSFRNHIGSQKHKAKEAHVRRFGGAAAVANDEASSVMSSTFSLGDPVPSGDNEVDSAAEEEFSEVVEGLEKTSLKERPSPVKRPSHPEPSTEEGKDGENEASEEPKDAASSTSTPTPGATLKSCLFCNYDSPSVDLNVVHMERIHSMFLPEKQYLVDLEGLLSALQKRIQEYHECLYCGKLRNDAFATQTHMRDKGHCRIPFDTEDEQLEIGEYYDFRGTYSDDEEDSDDESADGEKRNGGAKLGARRAARAVGEDGDEVVEDEGWETDSSVSSVDSDEIGAVPVDPTLEKRERLDKHPHHSSHDPRHHHQKDGWHSHAHKHRAIFYDDAELHLPSGRAVGHRSLNKYYRQNLHSHPSAEERAERLALEEAHGSGDEMDVDGQVATRGDRNRNKAMVSRAEGGTGMLGVSEQKKKEVTRAEKRGRKQEHMANKKTQWRVNLEANNQKHHNYQILGG